MALGPSDQDRDFEDKVMRDRAGKRSPRKESPKGPDPDPTDAEPERHQGKRKAKPILFSESEVRELEVEYSDAIENILQQRESREREWVEYTRVYDAQPKYSRKDYPMDGASNIVVPLSFIYCNVLIARQMQMIFSVEPLWSARELNRMFADHTKPLERYFDWARRNVWNEKKVVKPFIQEVAKLGTSCIYNGWRDELKKRYDEDLRQAVPAQHLYGPDPKWVSLSDTAIPYGYNEIQGAPFWGHRLWFSLDRLRQLESIGYIEDLDEAIKGGPDDDLPVYKEQILNRGNDQQDMMQADRFGLYSFWAVWLTRDFDGDGYPEEHVMMLRTKTKKMVRIKPNPVPSQLRPYSMTRFIEREGDFYGVGIPEVIAQLQAEASTIHNQRRDRAHLSNIVMWVAGAGTQGLGNSIRPKSGHIVRVLDINQLRELRPSTNVQIDAYEEQVVTMLADRVVGVNELSEGKITSPMGRAAATTVTAMMQESARRFDFNTQEIRDALGDEGSQFAESYQTYGLPRPEWPGSPEAVLDPPDAQKVRQLLSIRDNLRQFMAIDLRVSTQAVNRESEKSTNLQLYDFVQKHAMSVMQLATGMVNPQMPPALKERVSKYVETWDKAAERVIQAFQAYELDDMLGVFEGITEEMAQQQPQPGMPGQGGPQQAQIAQQGNGALQQQ
jgi:hypothetical protein